MSNNVFRHISPRAFTEVRDLSLMTASGADAPSFLHQQLTNDVLGLAPNRHGRAGYCTPKGRLLCVMLQWKDAANHIHHLLPKALLEPTMKRLSMYVLRSKVVFVPKDTQTPVIALWGEILSDIGIGDVLPIGEGGFLLRQEDCPVLGPRLLWVGAPADAASQTQARQIARGLIEESKAMKAKELPGTAWRFSEIQCGLAWVWESTREAFIPQMINLELVGGVSFTKGCYPGQEIVARSQYLGKLKRRTFKVKSPAALNPKAGAEIWSSADALQPCGQVVDAVEDLNRSWSSTGETVMLVECTLAAWQSGDLHLDGLDGPALFSDTLPYAFPAGD